MKKSLAVTFASFVLALGAFTQIAFADAPCAVPGTPFLTVTQHMTEPDSGLSGDWASDSFTEHVDIWLGSDNTTFCATGTTNDGTFVTTGPLSPQDGVSLKAGITGTFQGTETWVLPSGTATTTSESSLTLPDNNSMTGSQFGSWQSSVFNNTAGASTYTFTYVADNGSSWTNADSGNLGDILNPTIPPSVVYVSASGDDNNVGSQAAPLKTISAAVTEVASGGTITVASGTYNESVVINKPVTINGSGATKPVITGASPATQVIKIDGVSGPVTLNNIEVNGGGSAVGDNHFNYGIFVNNSGTAGNPITISTSTIKNVWEAGSSAVGVEGSSYVLVHHNSISSFHKNGIRFIQSQGKFYNNTVMGDSVDGTSRVQNLVNLRGGSNVEIYSNKLTNAITDPLIVPTWDSAGILVSAYVDGTVVADSQANIHDNEISFSDSGIVVTSAAASADSSTATITNNYIHNTNLGINFEMSTGSAVIHGNSFGTVNLAVSADDGSGGPVTKPVVNAENNWWGTATSTDIAALVYSDVDFDPWYTNASKNTLSNDTHTDTVVSSGAQGQADIPAGVTEVQLTNDTKLDLSGATSTVSGDNIIVQGNTLSISAYTNGDLTSVDFSTPKTIGDQTVTVGQAVNIQSGTDTQPLVLTNSNYSNVSVSIPDDTTVLAGAGWDGKITPPSAASSTGAAPSGFSVGSVVVEVGSPTGVLLFDKPVEVILTGVTGGPVGYRPAGSSNWVQITNTCSGTYANPGAPVFPGECFISDGVNTKIVTFHMTTFGTLAAVTTNNNSGGGGGGGSGGGGVVSVTGDVNGDGHVNLFDFNTLMTAWGATGVNLAADLNRDGSVGILDFNLLMNAWTI